MRSTYRQQAHKPTATLYAGLSPEGYTVHTCKSRSDAYRISDRFTLQDGVHHTVRPVTRYNVREGF